MGNYNYLLRKFLFGGFSNFPSATQCTDKTFFNESNEPQDGLCSLYPFASLFSFFFTKTHSSTAMR